MTLHELPRLLDGRMKFRHLVLLDAIARRGTIVGAAAELHVTQPVATRGLRELEDILEVELFQRGPRGLTPTVYGEAFTEHARAILAQAHQAARHVVELAGAERGTVVVGTHLFGSNVLLPRAIAALKAERPNLTVAVRDGTPESLLVELTAGRLDLIVGRLTQISDEGFLRRKLYDESVVLVVRATHPLAGAATVDLATVAGYPWILPGPETSLRRELEELFHSNDVPLPTNRVEATSFLTVRQLLRDTDTIAALPRLITDADPDIVGLPLSLDPVGHSVGITMPASRTPTPSASALIEKLVEQAGEVNRRFSPGS
ncbi:LysR substrate-binding domain-containing protein [Amycolatopsis rhabdoformis]|uniref:LysR substrate-binding domain-containing protein n=1 Tax=Amycolatopsis rhabdoformis TaxID=1448059 RepID=A0ABZ1HYE7_9PSEU|nr:LysR substrate-binding domain-containing protein [Amycolatopsis rhabdoformis]WSE27151.1 LysR substrate-binding domain-containing protein [Amycolatopsis rhabdoformis]